MTTLQAPTLGVIPQEDDVQVSIETITPEEATEYLSLNFATNRQKTETNIKRWAVDMKRGRWKLSTDCIAFDTTGRLINGQNRLSAVEKAGLPVQFLVARNFPSESIAVLDIGKRRAMHERITVGGEPMTAKECGVIRNAMARWSTRQLGTMAFSQIRHDEQVVKAFNNHKMFLKLMDAAGYMKTGFPGFFVVGALMIYAEGVLLKNKRSEDYDPLRRALQFLEVVDTGTMEHMGSFKRSRDGAALLLHQTYREAKARQKHWSTFDRLALTVKMAKRFDLEQDAKYVKEDSVNPFLRSDITQYPPTNRALVDHVINANYLSAKISENTLDAVVVSNEIQ